MLPVIKTGSLGFPLPGSTGIGGSGVGLRVGVGGVVGDGRPRLDMDWQARASVETNRISARP